MSLFHGINVVAIVVADLDHGRRFYRDVLELGEPVYDLPDAGWIEFETGAPGGNLAITTGEVAMSSVSSTTVVGRLGLAWTLRAPWRVA